MSGESVWNTRPLKRLPTPSVTPFVDGAFLDFKLSSVRTRATSGRPLFSTTRSVLQDPTTGAALVLCQFTDTRPLPSTTRSVRQDLTTRQITDTRPLPSTTRSMRQDPTTRQITETRGEFSEEEVPQSRREVVMHPDDLEKCFCRRPITRNMIQHVGGHVG